MRTTDRAVEDQGLEQASACGLLIRQGAPVIGRFTIHATLGDGTFASFIIDRWD